MQYPGTFQNNLRLVLQCINGASSNPVEGRTKICQLKDLILTLLDSIFRRVYIYIWRYARCWWHLTLHIINVEKNVSRLLFHFIFFLICVCIPSVWLGWRWCGCVLMYYCSLFQNFPFSFYWFLFYFGLLVYIFVLLVFSFSCLFQCLFVCLFISFVFPFCIYLLFMLCDCTLWFFLWKYILF